MYFYDVLHREGDGGEIPASDWAQLAELRRWGLPVVLEAHRVKTLQEVRAYHRDVERHRRELPFEVDGIVLKNR